MTNVQILTSKQKLEMNKAIIQYLETLLSQPTEKEAEFAHNIQVLDTLSHKLNVDRNILNEVIPQYLEKKWSTVLRLQKRIMDLETDITNLKSAMEHRPEVINANGKINWLPTIIKQDFKSQSTQQINTVAIHPFLPIILCGCSDGSIIIWNLAIDDTIPEKIIKAHTRGVNSIVWSQKALQIGDTPDYVFVSASSDLTIKVWHGSTYKQVRNLIGHEHTVSSLICSSANPKHLYSVSRDKHVRIWDIENGNCIKSFIGHSDWVRGVDVINLNKSQIGDFIITCSNDQSIRLSHGESGTGLALLVGHGHVVEDVKFLPLHSNKYIDKFIETNQQRFASIPTTLASEPLYTETLGYKYCVSAGRDNSVKLWLLPPPSIQPHRSPLPSTINNSQGWLISNLLGHTSWVKALAIHPNGRFIFSASDDKTIKIWDLETLIDDGSVKCINTLTSHDGFVTCIDFAGIELDEIPKDEQQLLSVIESKMRCIFVSGGVDNTVKLWK